jgi:hypothetical protein
LELVFAPVEIHESGRGRIAGERIAHRVQHGDNELVPQEPADGDLPASVALLQLERRERGELALECARVALVVEPDAERLVSAVGVC